MSKVKLNQKKPLLSKILELPQVTHQTLETRISLCRIFKQTSNAIENRVWVSGARSWMSFWRKPLSSSVSRSLFGNLIDYSFINNILFYAAVIVFICSGMSAKSAHAHLNKTVCQKNG